MKNRLKELDGLRFVAAFLVVLSHVLGNYTDKDFHLESVFFDGGIAVLIFFVLSGYIITRLLCAELGATGTLDLKAFYIRRALRIWPASYSYIALSVLLGIVGFASIHPTQALIAAMHVWNYYALLMPSDVIDQGRAVFAHFWSLALEEQFYWIWPAALLLLRNRVGVVLAAIVLLLPLERVAIYFVFPSQRGTMGEMFHAGADPIALGALLSLNEARLRPWLDRLNTPLFFANLAFLLLACPLLQFFLGGLWGATYGRTIEALSAGILILGLANGAGGWFAALLRTPPLQFGGRISYSLYIWQQLFTLPLSIFVMPPLQAVVFSCLAATASYFIIEKPFLHLKDRFSVNPKLTRGAVAATQQ